MPQRVLNTAMTERQSILMPWRAPTADFVASDVQEANPSRLCYSESIAHVGPGAPPRVVTKA